MFYIVYSNFLEGLVQSFHFATELPIYFGWWFIRGYLLDLPFLPVLQDLLTFVVAKLVLSNIIPNEWWAVRESPIKT